MAEESLKYVISLKDLFTAGIEKAESSAMRFEQTIGGLQSSLLTLGGGIGIGYIGKEIFEAGTNMEALGVSLKTMLGSKEQADDLIRGMVKFAQETPFQQSEVATAGKQLLAYGFAANEVIPSLKSLGDVAAGLAQPIGEIAYLYGTIRTQGKAMTVDIRQFANRGIPIYEELAKVTGKSGEALQKMIEDGKINFPIIQKAFENMSGAGGKFQNLTQELSQTTGGQWSNLKDQVQQLSVDVFRGMQPEINAFIDGMKNILIWVKENANSLKNLAIAVGGTFLAFKTIGAASTIIKGLTFAFGELKFAVQAWTDAQITASEAMSVTPWGAIAAAIGLVVYGLLQLSDAADQAAEATRKFHEEQQDSYYKQEKDDIEEMVDALLKADKHLTEHAARQKVLREEAEKYSPKQYGVVSSAGLTAAGYSALGMDEVKGRAKAAAEALKEFERQNLRTKGGQSSEPIGSELSSPKASKIQNITFNFPYALQNAKFESQTMEGTMQDFAGKFTEFLTSLVTDASIVAVE